MSNNFVRIEKMKQRLHICLGSSIIDLEFWGVSSTKRLYVNYSAFFEGCFSASHLFVLDSEEQD